MRKLETASSPFPFATPRDSMSTFLMSSHSPMSPLPLNIPHVIFPFFTDFQELDEGFASVRLRPPHRFAGRGQPLRLTVQCIYPQLECYVDAHTNEPLMLLRYQVASLLSIKPTYTQLWYQDDILRQDRDYARLGEFGIVDNSVIEAKQVRLKSGGPLDTRE